MSKKKTIQKLQVESLATHLGKDELDQVKGGIAYVKGKRFTFRVRWTSVDTRAEIGDPGHGGSSGG